MADISDLEDIEDEDFEIDPVEQAQAEKDADKVDDLLTQANGDDELFEKLLKENNLWFEDEAIEGAIKPLASQGSYWTLERFGW